MKVNTVGQTWVWGGEGSEIVKEINSGRKFQVERTGMGGKQGLGMGSWCALSPCPYIFFQAIPKKTMEQFQIPFLTQCVGITLPASCAEQRAAHTEIVWAQICTSKMRSQSLKASIPSSPHKYCSDFKFFSKFSGSGITRAWRTPRSSPSISPAWPRPALGLAALPPKAQLLCFSVELEN